MTDRSTRAGEGLKIPLNKVEVALFAARLRRSNGGRTCALAVMTSAPLLTPDCSHPNRMRLRERAMQLAPRPPMITPLDRGHLADLFLRTRLNHGLAEVRKTWGSGLRALLTELKYVLKDGAA